MPRGRQYYDPIIQVPGKIDGARDLSRIELYPEGAPEDPNPKWRGRLIAADGSIANVAAGDFDHDRALTQAQSLWPGLPVYELRGEGEDSTWEGHGPSPRLWKSQVEEVVLLGDTSPAPPEDGQVQLRVFTAIEPGTYVLLSDVVALLLSWAAQYEENRNPSAALGLNEAVEALREIG